MEATGLERIRTQRPVTNTVHNLIQTLSVKTSSAARYGLYQDDAHEDGMNDCADLFGRLGQQEEEAIGELLDCLREHVGAADS
jgi:rubrerythrin